MFFTVNTPLASVVSLYNVRPDELEILAVSLSYLTISLKFVGLNNVVPPVVLLHSKKVFVSVSSLFPLINRIALAVSLTDKSSDTLDFVALLYLTIFVLVSVN